MARALWVLLPSLVLTALPAIERPVTDPQRRLSAPDTERVSRALVQLRERTGAQMAVVLVDSTGGVPLADDSLRAARAWRGGAADRDDGLLFVLAVNDRQMRLEVGTGLEARLPEPAVRALLEAQRPLLLERDYAGALTGVIQGVEARLAPPRSGLHVLLLLGAALGLLIVLGRRAPLPVGGLLGVLGLLATGSVLPSALASDVPLGLLLGALVTTCGLVLLGRGLLFVDGASRLGVALMLGTLLAAGLTWGRMGPPLAVSVFFLQCLPTVAFAVLLVSCTGLGEAVLAPFLFLLGRDTVLAVWHAEPVQAYQGRAGSSSPGPLPPKTRSHRGSNRAGRRKAAAAASSVAVASSAHASTEASAGGSSVSDAFSASASDASSASSDASSASSSDWSGGGGSFGGGGADSSW